MHNQASHGLSLWNAVGLLAARRCENSPGRLIAAGSLRLLSVALPGIVPAHRARARPVPAPALSPRRPFAARCPQAVPRSRARGRTDRPRADPAVSQPPTRPTTTITADHGSSQTSLKSFGIPEPTPPAPRMSSARSQAMPTSTQPSRRPCTTPTRRHHRSTAASAGSAAPISSPMAPGTSSARDLTAARTVLDHGLRQWRHAAVCDLGERIVDLGLLRAGRASGEAAQLIPELAEPDLPDRIGAGQPFDHPAHRPADVIHCPKLARAAQCIADGGDARRAGEVRRELPCARSPAGRPRPGRGSES